MIYMDKTQKEKIRNNTRELLNMGFTMVPREFPDGGGLQEFYGGYQQINFVMKDVPRWIAEIRFDGDVVITDKNAKESYMTGWTIKDKRYYTLDEFRSFVLDRVQDWLSKTTEYYTDFDLNDALSLEVYDDTQDGECYNLYDLMIAGALD